jgi:3-hydroxy-3-methylglutaryl CoA synthase
MSSPARGVLSYGAYVPFWRLQRSAIGAALGGKSARGTRSVASYDEDSTSMAVVAARIALRGRDVQIDSVLFATTAPAYQDKTNATGICAALPLGTDVLPALVLGSETAGPLLAE